MARLSEYDSIKDVQKVKDYLSLCVDQEEQRLLSNNSTSEHYEYKLRVKLPSIEGLALFMNRHKDTIYDWEKKYVEFSDVIAKLRHLQVERLINNGLSGDYSAVIAKVLLSKHGYREIRESEVYGKDGKDLLLPEARAKEILTAL